MDKEIESLKRRIVELEVALRPFAEACIIAEEYSNERAAKFRNPVDRRDWFMWQASRSLSVSDFNLALLALGLKTRGE